MTKSAIAILPETLPAPIPGEHYSQALTFDGFEGDPGEVVTTATGVPEGIVLSPAGLFAGDLAEGAKLGKVVVTAKDGNGSKGTITYDWG